MDDNELIARLAGGDETALRVLFSRHAPMLAARLRVALPASDVEDVLQETFLAAWRGAGAYRSQSAAGGWLWGIARRQAALALRRRGSDGHVVDVSAVPDISAADDVEGAAIARTDLAAAVDALGPADSAEREVWRLLYVEDRSVAQVARLTGVPEGTVKSRAHRVRRLLRAALLGHATVREGS